MLGAACVDLPCHSERSIEDAESKNPFLLMARRGNWLAPLRPVCALGTSPQGEALARWGYWGGNPLSQLR